MVNYYHTSKYVFAVANGYIASVTGSDGSECPVSLVGAKLLGGLDEHLELVETEAVTVGHRLKFELGNVGLISDRISKIEDVSSFSIPPTPPADQMPESIRIRDPIPTLPEILYPNGRR